ncbi:MAG: IS21-like element helper ATPase IstB [Deltaproteobacteria bacterium]|nr:IS21-like element helper ATPase IstB [Deltaproteobacteria bacterium]
MNHSKLHELLQELKFKGIEQIVDDVLAKAEKKGYSTYRTLTILFEEEIRYKKERSLINRIKNARIPWDWTLTSFPFERQPGVNKQQIMDLSAGEFVERGENIVFIGEPGVGKSGLAAGLLRETLLNGYRGLYYNVQDLVNDLYASLADRSTTSLLHRLCRFDVLFLDEMGYLTLNSEQMNCFFKLMAERYLAGKGTIITTNLEYDKWYDLFKPKDMVDAMLDRLQHRCITIQIKGTSLRKTTHPE